MQNVITNQIVSDSLTTPETPSISSAAMLVEVNISTMTGRKKDKKASVDVTHANFAASGMASVHKKLLGDCQELDAIQKFTANSRNLHTSMTMPWSNTGLRLLPTAQYFKYHQAMTDIQQEYWRLVDSFKSVYEHAKYDAQLALGDLFNPDEYPSYEVLASKFAFRLSYVPLPDAGDFRIDIGNEATTQLKEHYQSYYTTQLKGAMDDIWHKVHDNLSTLVRQLDVNDEGKGNRLYDSVFDRAIELTEMLGTCNVTGDIQMEAMRCKLEDALHGVNTEALKEDTHLRAQTKRNMTDIIKSLPSIGM